MTIPKVLWVRVKKEWRALCFWTGITILVLSMLNLFVLVDVVFKEGLDENTLTKLFFSLLGLLLGNILWVVAGERSIFEDNGTEEIKKG